MKQIFICIILILFTLSGCSGVNREALVGKWQAVKLENQEMDNFFKNSQAYIDTVGKGHDSATNMRLYGVANMDSMRNILQQQYDSTKAMQMGAVTNTVFKFREDSLVELSFNGSTDTSTWYIGKDDTLIMVDLNAQKSKDTARLKILALSGGILKLKFAENNTTSTVTFHKEEK